MSHSVSLAAQTPPQVWLSAFLWPLLLHWPSIAQVLLAPGKPCSAPAPAVGSVKQSIYSLYPTRLGAFISAGKAPAVPSSLPSICSQSRLWTSLLPVPAILPPPLLKCHQTQGNAKGISGPLHTLLLLHPPSVPHTPCIPSCPLWAGSTALCFREQLSTFLASKYPLSNLSDLFQPYLPTQSCCQCQVQVSTHRSGAL